MSFSRHKRQAQGTSTSRLLFGHWVDQTSQKSRETMKQFTAFMSELRESEKTALFLRRVSRPVARGELIRGGQFMFTATPTRLSPSHRTGGPDESFCRLNSDDAKNYRSTIHQFVKPPGCQRRRKTFCRHRFMTTTKRLPRSPNRRMESQVNLACRNTLPV